MCGNNLHVNPRRVPKNCRGIKDNEVPEGRKGGGGEGQGGEGGQGRRGEEAGKGGERGEVGKGRGQGGMRSALRRSKDTIQRLSSPFTITYRLAEMLSQRLPYVIVGSLWMVTPHVVCAIDSGRTQCFPTQEVRGVTY